MIALAHNHMQMRLALPLRLADPLFQHVLRFLDEQPVQIDSVAGDPVHAIVFAEYEVARLAVVLVHFRGVSFAFFGELVGGAAVAFFVGLVCAVEA
jgi:hypothetical protein